MPPQTGFTSLDPGSNKNQNIRNTADIIAHTTQLLGLKPGRTARIENRLSITKQGLVNAQGSLMSNTGQISARSNTAIKAARITADHHDPFQEPQEETSLCNTSCAQGAGDRSSVCVTSQTKRQSSPGERRHPKSGSS